MIQSFSSTMLVRTFSVISSLAFSSFSSSRLRLAVFLFATLFRASLSLTSRSGVTNLRSMRSWHSLRQAGTMFWRATSFSLIFSLRRLSMMEWSVLRRRTRDLRRVPSLFSSCSPSSAGIVSPGGEELEEAAFLLVVTMLSKVVLGRSLPMDRVDDGEDYRMTMERTRNPRCCWIASYKDPNSRQLYDSLTPQHLAAHKGRGRRTSKGSSSCRARH